MKKILLLLLILVGCISSSPYESKKYIRTEQTTFKITNSSFYDVIIYFNNVRQFAIESGQTRCLVLNYVPLQSVLSFRPLGSTRTYYVPKDYNFKLRENWIWDIGNNYDLSANVGISYTPGRCGK